ncbi:MAG: hypothetical protein FIA95_09535 [Gemmatimonadetes bacterium]|nr:hypothetical protein [Gemmatimonadota bacterium]
MKTLPLLLALALCSTAASRAAAAQEVNLPTPEEYAERARKAEAAPLFASHEPRAVTLRTDISRVRDERSDTSDVEGTLLFTGPDGTEVSIAVGVRARGDFRRQKRNCNFPPIRLDIAGKEAEGTVFDGQDKLKLVTPCQDNRDQFQQYILQEYLVYRAYQLLTPVGHRVRLVTITYEDPDGGYETRTKTGFLIESDEDMAARNRATVQEFEQFHPAAMQAEQDALVALFQYMIGNTDFSTAYFHNAVMVRAEDGQFLIVPYDFDWAGVVAARYAVPDPRLPIQNVRQRVFRGFCRENVDQAALIKRFNDQKEAIWALYEGMPGLEEGVKKRSLDYYEEFYKTLNDPRRYQREITRACQPIPS